MLQTVPQDQMAQDTAPYFRESRTPRGDNKTHGVVEKFSASLGHGKIAVAGRRERIHVTFAEAVRCHFDNLLEGDRLKFNVLDDDGRLTARDLERDRRS